MSRRSIEKESFQVGRITKFYVTAVSIFLSVSGFASTYEERGRPTRETSESDGSSEATHFRYAQAEYKAARMDAVFGTATWIRAKFWPGFTVLQKDRWLSLELAALARHCRWADIKRLYKAEGSGLALAEEVMSMIRVKEGYRRFRGDQPVKIASLGEKADRGRDQWASSVSEYRQFTSPQHLRVRVENLCLE